MLRYSIEIDKAGWIDSEIDENSDVEVEEVRQRMTTARRCGRPPCYFFLILAQASLFIILSSFLP
jgi:hypothetical protein